MLTGNPDAATQIPHNSAVIVRLDGYIGLQLTSHGAIDEHLLLDVMSVLTIDSHG